MVAVTYGVAPTADSKSAGQEKGVFTLMFEAIAASRMKQAERQIAHFRDLVAHDEDEPHGGW